MWAATWDCSQGGGTPARVSRRGTSAKKAIRICGPCWCKEHSTSWGPSAQTAPGDVGDCNWRNAAEGMGRNEPSSPQHESLRCCCIISGLAEKFTNPCTTTGPRLRWLRRQELKIRNEVNPDAEFR